MIRFFYITLALVCCTLFTACSNDDDVAVPDTETLVTAIVPDKILYTDDELLARGNVTRSILKFDLGKSRMVFEWEGNEAIGVFYVSTTPVSAPARTRAEATAEGSEGGESAGSESGTVTDADREREDAAQKTQNTEFTFKGNIQNTENSSIARFSNDNFAFDSNKFMVAYSPYRPNGNKPESRDVIKVSYVGQNAKANGTPKGIKPANAGSEYSAETEKQASSHLGAYDFLISDPIKPVPVGATIFQFKHVGATLRLYMRFPEGAFGGSGKKAKVKSLRVLTPGRTDLLVSDATLKINRNETGTSPSYTEVENEKTTTGSLELKFGTGGAGFEVPDNGDLISYMEFYPTNIPANTAILHVTVEVDGVERYFKSKYMTQVNISAGYLYQWNALQYEDIIELTATLQPWQDIVSGNISTEE